MATITNIQQAEEYITNFNFYSIINGDKESIADELETCETVALQHHADKTACRARTYLMYLNTELNNLKKATEIAEENLKFAKDKQLDDELLYMISLVAYLYQLTGNLSGAEELIQIASDRIPTIKEEHKISKIYLMIAAQYYFTNNKENCINAYKKCIEFALKTNNNIYIANCYQNYIVHLYSYNMYDEAYLELEKGISYAKKSKDKFILNLLSENFGTYYSDKRLYNKAIKIYRKSLNFYKSTNNSTKEISTSISLLNTFILNSEYSKALLLLKSIEQNSYSSDAKTYLRDIYELYVTIYEKTKKYKLAFDYLKKYNKINAEINNTESEEKIRNLQIQHEVKTIRQERDTATKLARVKHDFLSNMSHEIRTPINSILGICYLLQQDELSEKQANYIQRLHRSGEQLLGIINDVLDISKIEAGKFHIVHETFSVQKVVQDCMEVLKPKAESKNLTFSFSLDGSIPVSCKGDAVRIGQVLTNLLFNALKFTEKGGIRLTITKEEVNTHYYKLLFVIEDTGIGMTEEQIAKLFTDYEQAEQTTQIKFGGTGLGLSISKKLVELMGGGIEVRSVYNSGSIFSFYLPFEYGKEEIRKTKNSSTKTSRLKDKTIFIADDVEENRLVLKDLLTVIDTSIQTEFAENGQELINLVQQKMPDIILMDLDMPVMNGFETTAFIRNKFPANSIKIIACTASLLTLKREEILEMGFSNLLQKPFTIHQLADALINE